MSHIVIHSPQLKVGKVDYTTFESSKLDTSRRKFFSWDPKRSYFNMHISRFVKYRFDKRGLSFFNSFMRIIKPLPIDRIVASVNMSKKEIF